MFFGEMPLQGLGRCLRPVVRANVLPTPGKAANAEAKQ